MVTYNFSAINGTGADTVYAGISSQAPWLFPSILIFEFIIIMIAGVYGQNRKIGFSNIPMWGAIAGLTTTSTAFVLSAISGLIDITSISICFGMTLVFAAWFYLSDLD